jgi:hypothetical protein
MVSDQEMQVSRCGVIDLPFAIVRNHIGLDRSTYQLFSTLQIHRYWLFAKNMKSAI